MAGLTTANVEGDYMADSHAQQMVRALEHALLNNVGVTQIVADGQEITFASRDDMVGQYQFWKREAAREAGGRRPFRGVNIGGAW